MLEDLKAKAESDSASTAVQPAPATVPAEAPKRVFLAVPTSDMMDDRDKIRHELLGRSYLVLPEGRLPESAEDLAREVAEQLRTCCLSVHLIGARYGTVPEGDGVTKSMAWLQQELALRRNLADGSTPFHTLLWVPPDLQPSDSRQRDFLSQIENIRDRRDVDILRTPLDALKDQIFRKLSPPAVKKEQPRTGPRHLVYLISEGHDADAVRPIQKFLGEQGLRVVLPCRQGTPREIRQDHEETLRTCHSVLIFYGSGSESWMREKVRDVLIKVPTLERDGPLRAQAILIAPDPTPEKQDYMDPDFVIMRTEGQFDAQCLQPLLEQIREPRGAAA
jgi:hypothetical protein